MYSATFTHAAFTVIVFSVSLTNNGILIFEKKLGNFEKRWLYTKCWSIKQQEILTWIELSWAKVKDWWGDFPIKFQVLGWGHFNVFFNLQVIYIHLHYKVHGCSSYLRIMKTQLLANISKEAFALFVFCNYPPAGENSFQSFCYSLPAIMELLGATNLISEGF